jgi:hypothetical protein
MMLSGSHLQELRVNRALRLLRPLLMLSLKLRRHLWLRPLKLCHRLQSLQIRHRLRPSKLRHRRILLLLPRFQRRLLRMLFSRRLLLRTSRLLHLRLRSQLPQLHCLLGLLGLCKLLGHKTPLLNMAK